MTVTDVEACLADQILNVSKGQYCFSFPDIGGKKPPDIHQRELEEESGRKDLIEDATSIIPSQACGEALGTTAGKPSTELLPRISDEVHKFR
jgi:hypothetical protein